MTSSLLEPPTAPMPAASGLTAPVDDVTRKEFLGGLLAAGVLAGCGAGEPATDAAGTRDVTDAFGRVTLPRKPQRIVADSVGTYAHLASLGVTPIGAAIPADISPAYIGGEQETVKNLVASDGWTVNVEAALDLKPDLILAVGAEYNAENCKRYRAAMTTYCYRDQEITATLRGIARAIGREDAATAAIAQYDTRASAVRRRIAAAGLGTRPIGTVRFDAGDFIGIRVNDPSNEVLAELGLKQPTWPKPGDSGYVELSRENLHLLNAAHTLFVCTDDNVVLSKLDVLRSPLWRNLNAVRGGRVHFVGAWNGSDLLQLRRIVDDVERVLLRPS